MKSHAASLPADARASSRHAFVTAIETIQSNPHAGKAALSHLASLPNEAALSRVLDSLGEFEFPITSISFEHEQDSTPEGVESVLERLKSVNRIALPGGDHMGVLSQPDAITAVVKGALSGMPLRTR